MKNQEKNAINSPVKYLPYVNPKVEKLLKKLGIETIQDLLLHSPSRYLDFSVIAKIRDIRPNETFTIQGQIVSISNKRTWKRKINITEAIIEDDTGSIKAIWFNQPFIAHRLKKGQFVNFSGKIAIQNSRIAGLEAYFSNPAYEPLGKTELAHTGRIIPIYPETAGLTSRWIRFLMKQALRYAPQIPEIIPPEISAKENFPPIKDVIKNLHFPENLNSALKAKKQLAFQELLITQLVVLNLKSQTKDKKAPPLKTDIESIKDFISRLPFTLTNAQKKSAWQILQDMEKSSPMNRLLNGDVGSGKTIVAAIAALSATQNGWQVAYIAPTEILARQHFQTFCKTLRPFNLTIALATGSENKIFDPDLNQEYETKKSDLLKKIDSRQLHITIGTHALIQDKVRFSKLGLVIIDEQHRFGVNQRSILVSRTNTEQTQNSALVPHLLSMTATPIPRTLMLTIYGDLDISILNEMPKNRQKIITQITPHDSRQKTYDFIKQEIASGRQAFVICPRIESAAESEEKTSPTQELKTVKEEYEKLSKKIFPDLKIGMLHGKLKSKEKEILMKDFKENRINILVSTSVIEVGIDIPNATVMMIEGADRFGLAQLHQFRGRIGRGDYQSYCFLMADSENKTSNDRLQALVKSDNGFQLAERDLELRGPGEFLGTRQSGLPDMAFASFADVFLIEKTRNYAVNLLKKDPGLKQHILIKNELSKVQNKIHLE